jgi:hypothetical protein
MDPLIIPVAGIFMITILGGIGLGGVMIRFAIKPVVEDVARLLAENSGNAGLGPGGDERLREMEAQLEDIRGMVQHLSETRDFDRQLGAGDTDPHARVPGPRQG